MRRLALLAAFLAIPLNAGPEDLTERWNAFARDGNEFAHRLNGGIFDSKLARKLSAEWRAVEGSGDWPR